MVLGIQELHRLVKEQNLVENLSQRELENPEGAGFDIRVGEIYELSGQGFLGITERETPSMDLVAKYEGDENPVPVLLKPHTYYTIKTIESVNMPEELLAVMTPRSTLFRSGVYIFGGQTPPGYKGGLTMGLYNFRNEEFKLEMGARIIPKYNKKYGRKNFSPRRTKRTR
ncbi:MAG: hypothetical protein HYV77_01230 [Candidatus Wildermuthbacteria bacterium]|nr:hypothetical protein [Candidatus Wildermuthbacteria bacterium]